MFPSGFKVADGGLRGPEWAGSSGGGGRGDGREKGSLGLQSPAPSRAASGRAGVRGPAPDGCPWRLEGCGRASPPPTSRMSIPSQRRTWRSFPRLWVFLPGRPLTHRPCAASSTVFTPKGAWGPVPVGIASGEPWSVREPRVLLPQSSPPAPAPPRSHLPDTSAPLPSHLTDGGTRGRPAGQRAGLTARPRAGGGDGVPRGGPCSARSSRRCGFDSRSRSHFSPSRVMSRGSSQSWWGRAARPGPATQLRRAGGTTRGVGDPSYARPSLSRPAAPSSGTVGGTAHGQQYGLEGGAALLGGRDGGRVGCPRCHGDAAPPRGLGRELAAPSGCALRLRSDQAPGTRRWSCAQPGPHSLRVPAHSGTSEARVFDPNKRLRVGGVGSAVTVPSGRRAEGRQYPVSGRHVGRRAAREEGRRRAREGAGEKTSNSPPGREEPAHRTQSPLGPPPPPPGSLSPSWERGAHPPSSPGMRREPIQPRPGGRVH